MKYVYYLTAEYPSNDGYHRTTMQYIANCKIKDIEDIERISENIKSKIGVEKVPIITFYTLLKRKWF